MDLEKTLYGPLSVPDWPDDLIVRALRTMGEWGAVEVAILASLVDPGEALYDVGAFLGTFSLGLAQQVALERVIAVEPNPAVVPHLRANMSRNLSCPFEVLEAGVGLHDGALSAVSGDERNHGAQAYSETVDPERPTVRSRGLRSLRAAYGDYSVLKLDIEGLEFDALRGDYKFLAATKPILWIECNEDPRSLDILQAMTSLGYEPVYVAFPAFRTANFLNSADLIYPMAYEAALLGAPRERLARLPSEVDGEIIIARPVANGYELRLALYDTPRWCHPEWLSMSRPELIARIGRLDKGIALKGFLR